MIDRTRFVIEPGQPTIVMERSFDAPRRLVWDAITKAEHLPRWWGPHGSSVIACDVDLRVGGAWRIALRLPDGTEHGFGGVYREITPPERLVQTFHYEGYREAEALETAVLTEQAGTTLLTVTVQHTSVENRNAHVASGMEAGAVASHDRLAELLRSLA